MCAAVTSKKTTQSTAATVTSNVTAALSAADNKTAQRLQTLGLVHQARVAQQTRTAASVTAKYGKSSPQAKAAAAAVTASKATVARLAVVSQQTTLAPPQVAAEGWALYGHVYHSQLQPAAAYTVFLVDANQTYQRAIGFAYTASDGSFQLSFSGAEKTALSSPLFLEVVNTKAQPVYLSATAFQPQIGKATYLDVTLPAGEPALGDPPADIRAVAIPNVPTSSTTSSQAPASTPGGSTPSSQGPSAGSQGKEKP